MWRTIEAELDGLPDLLRQEGRLLRQTLVTKAGVEDLSGLFDGPGLRAARSHQWLLSDLGRDHSRVDLSLTRAGFYCWAGGQLEGVSPFRLWLSEESTAALAEVVGTNSHFWERHRGWTRAHAEALLTLQQTGTGLGDPEHLDLVVGVAIPEKIAMMAACAWTADAVDPSLLESMVDHLAVAESVGSDLVRLRTDLGSGWMSPSIRWMAGDGVDLRHPPEQVMGELILAGRVVDLMAMGRTHLEKAREEAIQLGLPTFASYASSIALDNPRVQPPPVGAGKRRAIGMSAMGVSAMRMAIEFLLTDTSFRESWEVHRWGMLGHDEVVSRFPSGLVIESLATAGVDVTVHVDRFFADVAARGLAYYDHPGARNYIESDTLALLLRLYDYSSRASEQSELLDRYLALLYRHAQSDGRLPVWLVERSPAVMLGERCGTIEANLLIGLLTHRPQDHHAMLGRAASRLLAEYARRGSAINVNYPLAFHQSVMATLIDRLRSGGEDLPEVGIAEQRLRQEIVESTRPTPQTSACLLVATNTPLLSDLYRTEWRAAVLADQSIDGGWPAEPFFFAPSPDGARWHSSRLITSALCLRALVALGLSA